MLSCQKESLSLSFKGVLFPEPSPILLNRRYIDWKTRKRRWYIAGISSSPNKGEISSLINPLSSSNLASSPYRRHQSYPRHAIPRQWLRFRRSRGPEPIGREQTTSSVASDTLRSRRPHYRVRTGRSRLGGPTFPVPNHHNPAHRTKAREADGRPSGWSPMPHDRDVRSLWV